LRAFSPYVSDLNLEFPQAWRATRAGRAGNGGGRARPVGSIQLVKAVVHVRAEGDGMSHVQQALPRPAGARDAHLVGAQDQGPQDQGGHRRQRR